MKITVIKDDTIPAFGGYGKGSLEDGKPIMVINLKGLALLQRKGNATVREALLSTLMYEFGHMFEEYLNLNTNEDLIEKIVEEYFKPVN